MKIFGNMIYALLAEADDDDPMWMSKLAPKLKKGQLHRDLGIPQDETIPTSRLKAAAAQGGKVAQRANFALRARGESIDEARKMGKKDVIAEIPSFHERPDAVWEHNQWWAVCNACGWQAGASESSRGVYLETVTEGDGSCEENA